MRSKTDWNRTECLWQIPFLHLLYYTKSQRVVNFGKRRRQSRSLSVELLFRTFIAGSDCKSLLGELVQANEIDRAEAVKIIFSIYLHKGPHDLPLTIFAYSSRAQPCHTANNVYETFLSTLHANREYNSPSLLPPYYRLDQVFTSLSPSSSNPRWRC